MYTCYQIHQLIQVHTRSAHSATGSATLTVRATIGKFDLHTESGVSYLQVGHVLSPYIFLKMLRKMRRLQIFRVDRVIKAAAIVN